MPPSRKRAASPPRDDESKPDYRAAWLAKSPVKKIAAEHERNFVKIWFNACFNPQTQVATGKWMLFVQPVNKEPDTVINDIVESCALNAEVKVSKANQPYFFVQLFSQCTHIVEALMEKNYDIYPTIGKEAEFKAWAAEHPVVLKVDESILQVKISGDTEMFEHILEAEPIKAEKEPATFPASFVLAKKELASKLAILKDMATFWGIKLEHNGVSIV